MKSRTLPAPSRGWGAGFLPVALILLAGCSEGGGELSKKQDDELRNNFTRKLTPAEIAKLGGGPPAGAPAKGN